jgi:rhodanese-related sulfurtransferase
MNKLDYFKTKTEASISPMELTQAQEANPDKYVVVDVRNAPTHILKQKIAGAQLIPLRELSERTEELPKDKTIVLYCWDTWCTMAAKAAVILLEQGYDVVELSGGINAWNTMSFPVEALA